MGINPEQSNLVLAERISTDYQEHAQVMIERLEVSRRSPEETADRMRRMAVYSAFVDFAYPQTKSL